MGNSQSIFTEEELADYKELTYLTKTEILHVHRRFTQLNKEAVKMSKNAKLSQEDIVKIPELKVNPFKDRICKVFSSSRDGDMTFEDFLDMMSVFSVEAPKQVKVDCAFKIYDFDEDDMISMDDLMEVINRLTGSQKLEKDEVQLLAENIMKEADLDSDGFLSFPEFEHIISKSPDFLNSFVIRL